MLALGRVPRVHPKLRYKSRVIRLNLDVNQLKWENLLSLTCIYKLVDTPSYISWIARLVVKGYKILTTKNYNKKQDPGHIIFV